MSQAFDQVRDTYLKIYRDLDHAQGELESEAAIQALETGVDFPNLLKRISAVKQRLLPLEEKLQKAFRAKQQLAESLGKSLVLSATLQEDLRSKVGLPPNEPNSAVVESVENWKAMLQRVGEEVEVEGPEPDDAVEGT